MGENEKYRILHGVGGDGVKIEEAIEIILVNQGCVALDISNGDERLESGKFVDACDIAVSCMQKDIPKETRFIPEGAVYGVYCCTRCDTVVFYRSNYCIECGQKLKWGE